MPIRRNDNSEFHEANILKLDSSKIQKKLNWVQCLSIDETLDYTIQWYKKFIEENQNMLNFSVNQIEHYLIKINLLNNKWVDQQNE